MAFCSNCKNQVSANDSYCRMCGERILPPIAKFNEISNLNNGVLAAIVISHLTEFYFLRTILMGFYVLKLISLSTKPWLKIAAYIMFLFLGVDLVGFLYAGTHNMPFPSPFDYVVILSFGVFVMFSYDIL